MAIAKRQYVAGALTLEEYEESVEHVLLGGTLKADGRIPKDVEFTKHCIDPYKEGFHAHSK